jgi:hypothetical protein
MKPFDALILAALLTLGIIAVATDARRKRPVLLPQAPPTCLCAPERVETADTEANSLEWRAPMPQAHVKEPERFFW